MVGFPISITYLHRPHRCLNNQEGTCSKKNLWCLSNLHQRDSYDYTHLISDQGHIR